MELQGTMSLKGTLSFRTRFKLFKKIFFKLDLPFAYFIYLKNGIWVVDFQVSEVQLSIHVVTVLNQF